MVDVSLYGNITFDVVLEDFHQYKSIGSIGNVWDALVNLDTDLSIHVEPIEIGTALVLINTASGDKASKPNLQLRFKKPDIIESTWSHIAYINRIRDLSFIKEISSKTISADTAGKVDFDHEYLNYIDYLFISEDEIVDLDKLLHLVKKAVIVHSNCGSTTYLKSDKIVKKHEVLSNVNVLGCGDYFAAAFIAEMLKNENLDHALEASHKKTFEYLKNRI